MQKESDLMIQEREDLRVRVNCSREKGGDGKQLVCLLLDPLPVDPNLFLLDPLQLDLNPVDPISDDGAKENRFVISFYSKPIFQLVGSFWLGDCGCLGCARHLALQPSKASHSLGEDSQLYTGSKMEFSKTFGLG